MTLDEVLVTALSRHMDEVSLAPLSPLVVDASRQNDKRPAWLKLTVPDRVVANLKGDKDKQNLFVILELPRQLFEKLAMQPRIILASEMP